MGGRVRISGLMPEVSVMSKRWSGVAAAVVAMSLFAGPASACPMCKDTITDTSKADHSTAEGPKEGLPGGFNVSVYLMLCGFIFVLGLILWTIIKGIRTAPASRVVQQS